MNITHIKGFRFQAPLVQRVAYLHDTNPHKVQWHSHREYELHFILKGSCEWEHKGQATSILVPGGSFIVTRPGIVHQMSGGMGEPATRIGIRYKRLKANEKVGSFFAEDLRKIYATFDRQSHRPCRITPSQTHLLSELRTAITSFDVSSSDSRLNIRVLTDMLLLKSFQAVQCENVSCQRGDVIPLIADWINANLDIDISTAQLVQKSGYSRSRFFSLFLEEMGMSPSAFVVRCRIKAAKRLLKKRSDMSIRQVATSCGFRSSSTFAAIFRKFTGISPTDFRSRP